MSCKSGNLRNVNESNKSVARSSIGGPTSSMQGGLMNELQNLEGFGDNNKSDNKGTLSQLDKLLTPSMV